MRSVCFAALCCAALVGCNQSAPEATVEKSPQKKSTTEVQASPVNAICPIMGGEVAEDGGSTTWEGKLIGFCCPSCEPKWQKLSDEEKAEKLAAADAKAEERQAEDRS